MLKRTIIVFASMLLVIAGTAQKKLKEQEKNLIYIDKSGVMRYTENNKEAAFFGVNYTIPFAYGYRSHNALNVDIKKAMEQDVYHLARLGVDAFRVHVWDTEITDTSGNLLVNEHLQLFDYLISLLKARNIKIIITPLAFWGNGYPERDEHTKGFSSVYNKQHVLVEEKAIVAQENYLQQFLRHTNSYTGKTYTDDKDVIAIEVNNEPNHSGPREKVTEYVNRMIKSIKSAGWTKPVFYNISESPYYASDIAKSNADGFSFQWYPTGLVSGHALEGNYLPNVDRYNIPFDSIPQFAGKARMVYEFDAADVFQSYMYPAMARSFRGAGMQWATQFAYDPMATAYANTEYSTHYLNLAYVPAKAISLLIAGKTFRSIPRLKAYGIYPNDSLFDAFRVSYKESLSEMNTAQEFYYSGTTQTKPVNEINLQHIAGVGSSPVVAYTGSGAYFLDQLEPGVWRLEVMPDAVMTGNPFGKNSLKKEVCSIQWNTQQIGLKLSDLGNAFTVKGINTGNSFTTATDNNSFAVNPGTYLLVKINKDASKWSTTAKIGVIQLNEFVAPKQVDATINVIHQAYREVTEGRSFTIQANVIGAENTDTVTLFIHRVQGDYRTIIMQQTSPGNYTATIPAEIIKPGLLEYNIMVSRKGVGHSTFPGNHPGNPYDWDYTYTDRWVTLVAAKGSPLELYKASGDKGLAIYPAYGKNMYTDLSTSQESGTLLYTLGVKDKAETPAVLALQYAFADQIRGRSAELSSFNTLVVKAKTTGVVSQKVRVGLMTSDGVFYATDIILTDILHSIEVPISSLTKQAVILMPRPYPGFQPLWFTNTGDNALSLQHIEKVELMILKEDISGGTQATFNISLDSVQLK